MVSYVLSYSSFWIHAHRKALVGGITLKGQDERKEGAVAVATGMAARARRNRHTSAIAHTHFVRLKGVLI